MEGMKVIKSETYAKPKYGISMFSGNRVEIIGEQTVEYEGRLLEQYIYNIVGYTPENGKPFISLKSNIIVDN